MDHVRRALNCVLIVFLLVALAGLPAFAAQSVKTVNGVAIGNVKAFGTAAKANVKSVLGVDNTAGGGGGPDTYYDIEISANATGNRSSSSAQMFWQGVTVTTGGSATKMRWYCRAHFGGSETVKVALYNAAGTSLLASGSGSVTSTGYFDITFSAAATVTSATNYILATSYAGGSAELGVNGATGTYSGDNNGGGFAAFPLASLPAADSTPTGKLVMGLYVD